MKETAQDDENYVDTQTTYLGICNNSIHFHAFVFAHKTGKDECNLEKHKKPMIEYFVKL